MSWYVVKGRGRLHVENTCTAEDWVMGPVPDYQDAFDWMEKNERRSTDGGGISTLLIVLVLFAVVWMMPGGW